VSDDTLVVLLNASHEDVVFRLPAVDRPFRWLLALDTARPEEQDGRRSFGSRARYTLPGRSLAVLRHPIAAPATSLPPSV
jgi:glycogen operon protein